MTNFTVCNSLRTFFFCSKIKKYSIPLLCGLNVFYKRFKIGMYHNFIFCVELTIF